MEDEFNTLQDDIEIQADWLEFNASQDCEQDTTPRPPEMIVRNAVILPAPNKKGIIKGRNGRVFNVSDPKVLASKLNRQEPKIRLDIDHRSEAGSYGYMNEPVDSRALGWLTNIREMNGAILADIEINSYSAAAMIKERGYRYLSPALMINKVSQLILGMTSIALVNNPNLKTSQLNNQQSEDKFQYLGNGLY